MASMQVEGANTGSSANDDELASLRDQLRAKNLYSILDMCSEYTRTNLGEEWTLQTLVGMRKNDVLELIDAINADESVSKNVGILQKVAFANMIQKYADQQNVAPPDHVSTNTDPSKHMLTDKEERVAILSLSEKIKSINESILSVSETATSIDTKVKECEAQIDRIFDSQINKLKERKKEILNELHQIADRKKTSLSKQTEDLTAGLSKMEAVHKNVNAMVQKPISLEEIDTRKAIIVKQCDEEISVQMETEPIASVIIDVNADCQYLEKAIHSFCSISSIPTPTLVSLVNDGRSGIIAVEWEVIRYQRNQNEKMKIEWKLQNENDDEKEEKEMESKSKIVSLKDEPNGSTVSVSVIGVYEVALRYNNGINEQFSPKSMVKSIQITQAYEDLIIAANETKILDPDKAHKFNKVVVNSGATLTTQPWNGNVGGKLLLQALEVIIKSNGKIDVDGKGYRGGKAKNKETNGTAYQGESFNGVGGIDTLANDGGGGGGIGSGNYGSVGGGGGGYGSRGNNAETNTYYNGRGNNPGGIGGNVYGDSQLSTLYLGSGGGSGHPYSSVDGYPGGNGGGAIQMTADKIVIEHSGKITANGQNAPPVNNSQHVSGGGGGSGGSIYLKCKQLINEGHVTAKGGTGAAKGNEAGSPGICSNGGDGGSGRIRIDTSNLDRAGSIIPSVGYTEKY